MQNSLLEFYKKIRLKPDTDAFTVMFVVVLFSLGLGIYNNYLLRSGSVPQGNTQNAQNFLPIKDLTKKIPQNAPKIGDSKAKVVIVAFEDFKCPFCKRFHDTTFPDLKRDYIDTGKVLFIHQDLAFLSLESTLSAEAAQCANDQNRFWEYKDALYENTSSFTDNSLKDIANKLGLNMVEFNECYDGKKYKDVVAEAKTFASTYGISSTPTFVINDVVIKGARPITDFENAINSQLK